VSSTMRAVPEKALGVSFARKDLVRDLYALGLRPGDLINAKVSLKAIGHVDGGADTVLEALIEAVGPNGTVVTDSFLDVYPLPLSPENAGRVADRMTPSYAGALANALVRHPRAFRSGHPVQKFAAIGAQAEELMAGHGPRSYAYDVLRVMAERGGRNVKIGSEEKTVGVGTTHVAIGMLKLRQKRSRSGRTYFENGRVVTFERDWAGACARGFANFMPHYRRTGGILSEGTVGRAPAKITDMKRTLEVEVELLRDNPWMFMCEDQACVECRLSWEFSTGSLMMVILENLRRGKLRDVGFAVRTRLNRNFLPRPDGVFFAPEPPDS
jgi:aminoglycoside 3-N-acetyltransferase